MSRSKARSTASASRRAVTAASAYMYPSPHDDGARDATLAVSALLSESSHHLPPLTLHHKKQN